MLFALLNFDNFASEYDDKILRFYTFAAWLQKKL